MIASFTDEIDGDVLLAKLLAVGPAHPVHALAGCFHLVGTANALCEIIMESHKTWPTAH
jgi:hypothetical protein